MRKPLYFLMLISAVVFGACGKAGSANLSSASPSGGTKVSVVGSKASFAEPFLVSIAIENGNKRREFQTEIYAGDLNNENVVFEWLADNECRLTFTQQDNTMLVLKIKVQDNEITVQEM